MPRQPSVAPRKQSRSKRAAKQTAGGNGQEEQLAKDEQALASYLEERIKPGLNRGAIPLVARSIASEIAREDYRDDGGEAEEPGETEEAGEDEGAADLEANLHKLQAQLGEDWILYFSVQGGKSWLTAEKEDATQRLEAPSAAVLTQAIELLNGSGGRSGSPRRAQKKAR
jgi:hypothetical protein